MIINYIRGGPPVPGQIESQLDAHVSLASIP